MTHGRAVTARPEDPREPSEGDRARAFLPIIENATHVFSTLLRAEYRDPLAYIKTALDAARVVSVSARDNDVNIASDAKDGHLTTVYTPPGTANF
jgi:hypothetical protein